MISSTLPSTYQIFFFLIFIVVTYANCSEWQVWGAQPVTSDKVKFAYSILHWFAIWMPDHYNVCTDEWCLDAPCRKLPVDLGIRDIYITGVPVSCRKTVTCNVVDTFISFCSRCCSVLVYVLFKTLSLSKTKIHTASRLFEIDEAHKQVIRLGRIWQIMWFFLTEREEMVRNPVKEINQFSKCLKLWQKWFTKKSYQGSHIYQSINPYRSLQPQTGF